jgi:DNA-binding transcriptional ArsR family regulator
MAAAAHIDLAFAALGDPTRRAIVERLARGDATVLELAAPFDISLPAVSRHLKILERAGLISRGKDAQRRPCSLRPEAMAEISAWAEHTREAWEQRLDRLDDYIKELARSTTPAPEQKKERGRNDRKRR